MRRRAFSVWAVLALTALSISGAGADTFPTRNITLIVPSAPGGFADTIARLLAPGMQAVLQKQIIVDSRSGAALVSAASRALSRTVTRSC